MPIYNPAFGIPVCGASSDPHYPVVNCDSTTMLVGRGRTEANGGPNTVLPGLDGQPRRCQDGTGGLNEGVDDQIANVKVQATTFSEGLQEGGSKYLVTVTARCYHKYYGPENLNYTWVRRGHGVPSWPGPLPF